jgi:hypothetical protein
MKQTQSIPAIKIKMMEASMRCLTYGLLGLLPVIGLPFALAAGWQSGVARAREKQHWNPARKLRLVGFSCAIIGALTWTIVDVLVIWQIYNNYINGGSDNY